MTTRTDPSNVDIITGKHFKAQVLQSMLTNDLSLATVVLARKTVDETVASNTTPQDDDDLFRTMGAGELWFVKFVWKVSAAGAVDVDFKVQFDAPTGAEICIEGPGISAAGALVIQRWFDTSTTQVYNVTSTTPTIYTVSGLVYTAGVGGTFRMKWAQGNSSATAVGLRAGSCLLGTRLGTNPRLVTP